MKRDEERILIFNVVRATDNRWQVLSDGLSEPIPIFDTPQDACSWAVGQAKARRGRVFVEKTPVDMAKERDTYRTPRRWVPIRFTSNQQ